MHRDDWQRLVIEGTCDDGFGASEPVQPHSRVRGLGICTFSGSASHAIGHDGRKTGIELAVAEIPRRPSCLTLPWTVQVRTGPVRFAHCIKTGSRPPRGRHITADDGCCILLPEYLVLGARPCGRGEALGRRPPTYTRHITREKVVAASTCLIIIYRHVPRTHQRSARSSSTAPELVTQSAVPRDFALVCLIRRNLIRRYVVIGRV